MNVLVIGGTSFMGPFAVRELVNAGHRVTVFHRGQTNHGIPPGAAEIQSDVMEIGSRRRLPELADQFAATTPDVVLDMLLGTQDDAEITIDLLESWQSVLSLPVVAMYIAPMDVSSVKSRAIQYRPRPLKRRRFVRFCIHIAAIPLSHQTIPRIGRTTTIKF